MAHIAIVTTGHLSTSPRVVREADALAAAGHDVVVIGAWYDAEHAEWDLAIAAASPWRFVVAADFRGTSRWSRTRFLVARMRSRVARARLSLGLGADRHALGYAVDALERVLRREKPALHLLHLEPALAIGERLLRDGARVAVDIEDWYSRIAADGVQDESLRVEIDRLERRVFAAARSATTTSAAMSAALAVQTGMVPADVVYNGVASIDAPRADMPETGPLRLVWFSQIVAPGRGLELLAAALETATDDWVLTIVGAASASARAWFESLLPAGVAERVRWEPPVSPRDLGAIVAGHHVGLALETGATRNLELTVSNKICHYLQCGLVVAATDTAGQREVMARVGDAGCLVDRRDPALLREALIGWMADPSALAAGIDRRHASAKAVLSADAQAPRLVAAAARALGTA